MNFLIETYRKNYMQLFKEELIFTTKLEVIIRGYI